MIKYKLNQPKPTSSPLKSQQYRESVSTEIEPDYPKKIIQKSRPAEQQSLNLSPDYLIPKGDPLKELGFGSENKENVHFQIAVDMKLFFLFSSLKLLKNS